jgi:hypothetical protein
MNNSSKQALINFCSQSHSNMYVTDDIDYLLNMIRLNQRSVEKSHSMNIIHGRAMNTIQALCKEFHLDNLSNKLALAYGEVSLKWLMVAGIYKEHYEVAD